MTNYGHSAHFRERRSRLRRAGDATRHDGARRADTAAVVMAWKRTAGQGRCCRGSDIGAPGDLASREGPGVRLPTWGKGGRAARETATRIGEHPTGPSSRTARPEKQRLLAT